VLFDLIAYETETPPLPPVVPDSVVALPFGLFTRTLTGAPATATPALVTVVMIVAVTV
jgi:hypothetical protein